MCGINYYTVGLVVELGSANSTAPALDPRGTPGATVGGGW